MPSRQIFFSGVHGATGGYLQGPLDLDFFAGLVRGQAPAPAIEREPKSGINPEDLASAGWAVIFPEGIDPRIVEALRKLLDRRREMAGERYLEYRYPRGLSARHFLDRGGVGPGPADPERFVPYYVLLVGGPEEIPFSFQSQLGVRYAVGRICFEAPEHYVAYAETVIAAEDGEVRRPRRAAFFGVENPNDRITPLSVDKLVEPLARSALAGARWSVDAILRQDATKSRLATLLGGRETPAVLMTVSHAVGFDSGDPNQRDHQGALLCREWPGPSGSGGVSSDHFFGARDIPDSADLAGLIAVHVGCFTAGTPSRDSYDRRSSELRRSLAPKPFVARLPERLLGHLKGGALAVIGHVDIAYEHSFLWLAAGEQGQYQTFETLLADLLAGKPAGLAMETFGRRHGELATDLLASHLNLDGCSELDDSSYARMWTAYHDSRNYVLLGDPAVRVPEALE